MYRDDCTASLICDECGECIRSVSVESVERELASLAVTCGYSRFACAPCGTLNICTEVALTDALTCPRCGVGMAEEHPLARELNVWCQIGEQAGCSRRLPNERWSDSLGRNLPFQLFLS